MDESDSRSWPRARQVRFVTAHVEIPEIIEQTYMWSCRCWNDKGLLLRCGRIAGI